MTDKHPLPWTIEEKPFGALWYVVIDAKGGEVLRSRDRTEAEDAMKRKRAEAAQVEYGWHAERIGSGLYAGTWKLVGFMTVDDWTSWAAYVVNAFPDPATALSTAYEWKKAREKVQGRYGCDLPSMA